MRSEERPIGFFAHPDGGAVPGVVIIPDVWGLSDLYRGIARRLAADGFAALAIDPYRKTGKAEITDPLAWIRTLSDPVILETVQEAIDALATPKVGVMGCCMGGQYALLAACSCRGLSACVSFYGMVRYGSGLDPARKPRSPLDAIADLRCPLLGLYGEEDAFIPVADVEELRRRLAAAGKDFDLRLYPGAGHAFMNDTRPAAYRPEAAADAWRRMLAFFRERLA
ncbi:MAG TPA: dienelactone hydrolase family protein [Candidatus Binatia bacterium]|nr:dienelactone hydrolase family protein [Candidatus Binatia bacterium]